MFDVLIVGAGMVGASLACALGDKNYPADRPLKVGIIEANGNFLRGEFTADGRASAIAYGSSQIWQNIGVWGGMQRRGVTPMHAIQVSEGDLPYQVQLRREDMGQEALGYIVENSVTLASLWEFARECSNLELICPAKILDIELLDAKSGSDRDVMRVKISSEIGEQYLETKLLVGADGGRSQVRQMAKIAINQRLYEQTCIVTTIQSDKPHHNFAHERFQPSGPFAILPLGSDRSCIVWTATTEETPHLLALDDSRFLQELTQRFGSPLMEKLGKIKVISRERANYIPRWMHSQTYIQHRLALIGDAAHTTHPIAGQGMNLGIRDVNALAKVLKAAHQNQEDLGAIAVLKRYESKRKWDNLGVILLTDISNRLFSNHNWFFKVLRRFGLLLLQISPLKRILMYFMMGLHQV
ncbi:ubiquinone biosynthesis protein [Pseudanabaena sp. SR411]|uniref:UbiH/UbiF/VisC/COQ6 family ubiquinone biosynthesis hydroxylase n=1 Tax=Pseudanabaena sp. SR411 TaxID=1980935 RepID=UPI000B98B4B4|nr:UbiH/UbiF/VisC/COQ6 family ubiquinone biosynthesis hydroxylase [Pseudanabaena sp. SR411]OYQ64661.1 ubiquinone biosynthesis protein [Pseudanabaena sp. SR411]